MNAAHMEFCASPEWRQMIEEIVLPAALRDLDLGDDVVEVGPGPGFVTDVLRNRVERLTAVELDHELADRLRRRLAGTNVDVIEADATSLDLASDRFSGAASFNMLHHVPTDEAQDQILSELERVLRPGGVLVAADGSSPEDLSGFHDGDTYHPILLDALPSRLGAAGFVDIDVQRYDLGWTCTARAS